MADDRVLRAQIRFQLDEKGIARAEEKLKKYKEQLKGAGDEHDKFGQKAKGGFDKGEKAAKELEEALKILAASGKYKLNELSEETLKLEAALKKVKQSGKFKIEGLDDAGQEAEGLQGKLGKLQAAASAFIAVFAAEKVIGFFKQIAGAAVQANAEFEVYQTQFETLLGSAGAAQERIEELARFGVETPFELPEIVEASQTLETFTKGALATGDGLRMVGDIAAGVNRPFQDVAFWTGRMYDALQNGQPFGDAAMALQEMGALSGDTRRKMEEMQKAGASGAEIFAVFSEEVGGRFAGNMERLSGTFQGITSNLADFQSNLLRVGGEAYFEQVKEDAKGLLDILSDEERSAAIENLARVLGEMAAEVQSFISSGILESLDSIEAETIQDFADALERATAAVSEFSEADLSTDLNSLVQVLTTVIDTVTMVVNTFTRFKNALGPIPGIVAEIRDMIIGFINPLPRAIEQFGELNDQIEKLTGYSLTGWFSEAAEATETEVQHQEKLIAGYQEYAEAREQSAEAAAAAAEQATDATEAEAEAMEEATDAAEEYGEALEKIADANEKLATDMTRAREDIMTDHQRDMEDLEVESERKRLDIMIDAERERLDFLEESARKRADMARENARAIEDIERKNAQAVADAATELNRAEEDIARKFSREQIDLAKEQASRREDIETEHLRRIRDIRQQFNLAAEEAVRNQDAIGFLRSQRDREQQVQQAEQERQDNIASEQNEFERRREALAQQQERELEDARLANERKLEDLRKNLERELEEQRRKYERELQDQAIAEERKRADMQKALERELEDAKKAEERKRDDLKKALDRRLEDLAQTEERKKADLEKSLEEELEIVRKFEEERTKLQVEAAQARNETLADLERTHGPATPDNPNFPGGPPPRNSGSRPNRDSGDRNVPADRTQRGGRAQGGYVAQRGQYELAEQGREFVLNNATTRALESGLGGQLSQSGLVTALLANRGGGNNYSQSNQFHFAERDDARTLLAKVEQVVDRKFLEMERGY